MSLRDNIWVIGAIIYVGGMFPIFYFYQFLGSTDFGIVDIIATVGAFIVMAQALLALSDDKPVNVKSSK